LLFLILLSSFWLNSNIDTKEAIETTSLLVGYFENLHRFISPITNYHAFYLFWWFAWSIMIGQFVARFVNGVKTWQLLVALLTLPSIPIAVWFSILYYYHTNAIVISDLMSISMVIVGIIFVINSLDSLIRLYTENYNLTFKKLGAKKYILINFSILYGLVLMYQMTPFKIEWVGLTVIGLYSLVYFLIMVKRKSLK
jgi:choline-glycine betaine transporter